MGSIVSGANIDFKVLEEHIGLEIVQRLVDDVELVIGACKKSNVTVR